MRSIDYSDKRWPLVEWTFDGKQTDEDVEHFISTMEKLNHREEYFGTISTIGSYSPTMGHVKRLGNWVKEYWKGDRENYCIASAIVIPSDAFRLLLSSFMLITRIPFPYVVTGNREEGLEFLKEQLRQRGQEIPPE